MRVGRIEIRVHPHPRDWAVECWQWPHQEFVQRHKVKRDFVAFQMGPLEVGFWIINPGQYAIVPQATPHPDRQLPDP